MKLAIIILVLLNVACVSLSPEEEAIVGEWKWAWSSTDRYCTYYGSIGFRRDGKTTRTSEFDCGASLSDDGFGLYRYGWFREADYICFVDTREEVRKRITENRNKRCSQFTVRTDSAGVYILMENIFDSEKRPIRLHRSD